MGNLPKQRITTAGLARNLANVIDQMRTLPDDRIRLISAWKANQPAKKRYERQF